MKRVLTLVALTGTVIAGAVLGLGAAAFVIFGFLVLSPMERLFRRHEQPVRRPELRTDIIHAIFTQPLTTVVVFVPAIVITVALTALPLPLPAFALAMLPGWLQVIAAIVLIDFFIYWAHRIQHEVPFFWRFHKIHHSSQKLDWLSGARNHPGAGLAQGIIIVPPLLLLGIGAVNIGLFAVFLAVEAVLMHANVRWRFRALDGIVVTPEYHHWHHSAAPAAINKNYAGLLPIWDIAFGSAYIPKDKRPAEYGIAEPVPSSFRGQLMLPLRRSTATATATAERVPA